MASGSEIHEKERRARELMAREGFDALVLATTANFAWLTCGGSSYVGVAAETGAAVVVLTRSGKYVVCDNIEAPRIAQEETAGQGFDVVSFDWHEGGRDAIIEKIAGGGAIGADIALPGSRDAGANIDRLRWSLTAEEVDRYRELGRDVGECLAEACRETQRGMTEHEIAGMLNGKLYARGMAPVVTLIAADERIERYRHPLPTDKRAERRAMLVTGARKWGLVVSTTRLVSFGDISADLRRRHDAVVRIDAGLIARTTPGANVGEVFRRAVADYEALGFPDEWRLHHQGGPTGYKGREFRAGPATDSVVLDNQAFAWNPSITGTKSEDTIIAAPRGPVVVSEMEDWPTVDVEVDGMRLRRPDILIK